MTHKPFVPRNVRPPTRYTLPAEIIHDLGVVRDELRLFAAIAARRSSRDPEMVINRNALAHCFDHLAKRLDDIVTVLDEDLMDQVDQLLAGPYGRKN